jgi:response regulator RpfG family c-di-GMP phosphodiesterase
MNTKKPTILYVDDEKINLRLFKNTFRRNYNILLASSGKEGIEFVANNKVDIIITDQRMPNMTGVELLANIQEMFPSIPPVRLMLSGYSDSEAIDKAYKEYDLYKFISKPWEEDMLVGIFNEVLDKI